MNSNQILDSDAFMGFQYPKDSSKVFVLSAPYEGTSTYLKGQAQAPMAILNASNQVETYDIELKKDFIDSVGFHTLSALELQNLSVDKMVNKVNEATSQILKQDKFPLIFGGEHSISIGVAQAVNSHFDDVTVIQIDAHADMRNEYENSKFNHACVMARIREMMPAVSVGVRSMCKEEADVITSKYSDLIFGPNLDDTIADEIVLKIRTKHVYLTIDVDGFDPSLIPATGTPEPGGLGWYNVLSLIRKIAKHKSIIAMDITELSPIKNQPSSDFTCAKLAYKIIGYIFSK